MTLEPTQAKAGRRPDGERDAGGRSTLVALCVLSALFFAAALAYAIGGGLLGGGADDEADRGRKLPREWANMIPLQPLGPELAQQAENGDEASEVAGARNERRARRLGRGAGAGPLAQARPAPRPRAAPRPARLALPQRRARPVLRPILDLGESRRLAGLQDVGDAVPGVPDLPDPPTLPPGGGGTVPDTVVVIPDIVVVIPEIDPFPDGFPFPPIDPPGGGDGFPLPLPGDAGGLPLPGLGGSTVVSLSADPLTPLRSLESGADEAAEPSFEPLVLTVADSSATLERASSSGPTPEPDSIGVRAGGDRGASELAEDERPGRPSRASSSRSRSGGGNDGKASSATTRRAGRSDNADPSACAEPSARARPDDRAQRRCDDDADDLPQDADRRADRPPKEGSEASSRRGDE